MAKTKKSERDRDDREKRKDFLAVIEQPFKNEYGYRDPDDYDPFDGYDEDNPKHRAHIKRDKRGRPTVMTKQVLGKLRQAFSIGCTDREAAIFADIHVDTLYAYCKENPDFSDEKEELKDHNVIHARMNISQRIQKGRSIDDSWEYIKRKRKSEFSEAKQEVVPVNPLTEEEIEQGETEALDGEVVDTGINLSDPT